MTPRLVGVACACLALAVAVQGIEHSVNNDPVKNTKRKTYEEPSYAAKLLASFDRAAWDIAPRTVHSDVLFPSKRQRASPESLEKRQIEQVQQLNMPSFATMANTWLTEQSERKYEYPSLVLAATMVDNASATGFSDFLQYGGSNKKQLSDSTRFQIASISKTFTAVAVMQMVEQGKLSLDTDISTYLPSEVEVSKSKFDGDSTLTLRQLMTHVAGFEEFIVGQIQREAGDLWTLQDYLAKARPARVNPANTVPSYSNYAWSLAGLAVEHVSQMPFASYLDKNIFTPLDMSSSFLCVGEREELSELAPAGAYAADTQIDTRDPAFFQYFPAGSVWSTGPDMLKFAQMLLLDGQIPGADAAQRVLQARSVAEMMTNHWGWPIGTGYGLYHTYLNDRTGVMHDGDMPTFSSRLLLIPQENFALFISVGAGGAPARDDLTHTLADTFFEPRPARPSSDIAPKNPAEFSKDNLAFSYMNTRQNYEGCTKLLFVLSQLASGLTGFESIRNDAALNARVVPSTELVFKPLVGGGFWFSGADIMSADVKQALNDSDVDLDWVFGGYPFLNFSGDDDLKYATFASSLNGLEQLSLGFSASWVLLSLLLLIVPLCCCPCLWCISCCVRRCKSPSGNAFTGEHRNGEEARLVETGPVAMRKVVNNEKHTTYASVVAAFLMVFCNLVGSLGFIVHSATLVYGTSGATGFLLALPIISIVVYVFSVPLAIYAFVYRHWWIERRFIFSFIILCSFLMTFWFMNLNLLGNTCWA